jgi:hypothetical protein
MMLVLDMWYEDREPDFSKGDVLGPVCHNGMTGRYWANILDRDGKFVGDIMCSSSVDLDEWALKHGVKIDWEL